MALFSFGKKDKKPPEVPAPVAKAQPTPPKIQTPPGIGFFSRRQAPATDRFDAGYRPCRRARQRPSRWPCRGPVTTGLKPARPGTAQVDAIDPADRPSDASRLEAGNSTKPLTLGTPDGRINLPIGMILRCLPPEVLADDLSKFEANGAAATEIGLPMNMILGQLPSGKVEMTLAGSGSPFPAGLPAADRVDCQLSADARQPAADGCGHAHSARSCWRCVPTRRMSMPR